MCPATQTCATHSVAMNKIMPMHTLHRHQLETDDTTKHMGVIINKDSGWDKHTDMCRTRRDKHTGSMCSKASRIVTCLLDLCVSHPWICQYGMEEHQHDWNGPFFFSNIHFKLTQESIQCPEYAGGTQMAHPTKPGESSQNHHATSTKDQCWQMWRSASATSLSPKRTEDTFHQSLELTTETTTFSPRQSGTGSTCFCPPDQNPPHSDSPRSARGVRLFHHAWVSWRINQQLFSPPPPPPKPSRQ